MIMSRSEGGREFEKGQWKLEICFFSSVAGNWSNLRFMHPALRESGLMLAAGIEWPVPRQWIKKQLLGWTAKSNRWYKWIKECVHVIHI